MHINQDYKLYIADSHFNLYQKGRPLGDEDPKNAYANGDIKGSSPQINWYIDTDRKKIWLGKAANENKITTVFHEVIANTIYRNAFLSKKSIKVPKMVASQVLINKGVATHTFGLQEGAKVFSIMSRKVSDFRDFGNELIKQLNETPRQSLYVTNLVDSAKLPITAFWSLAAYSKWFGDIDYLGTSGGNAGYQIKFDENGQAYSHTVKIDPGFVGYGEGLHPAELVTKSIIYSSSGEEIDIDNLLPEERKEYFETIQEIVNYSDKEIKQLIGVFDTTNLSKNEKAEFIAQTKTLEELLIERRDGLKKLYQEELAKLPPYKKQPLKPEISPDNVEFVAPNNAKETGLGLLVSGLSAGIGFIASKWLYRR